MLEIWVRQLVSRGEFLKQFDDKERETMFGKIKSFIKPRELPELAAAKKGIEDQIDELTKAVV